MLMMLNINNSQRIHSAPTYVSLRNKLVSIDLHPVDYTTTSELARRQGPLL
jgi:hypothetical protein